MTAKYADTAFINGTIYAAGGNSTRAEALTVADGIIQYVGDDSTAGQYIGPETKVIDLNGKMIIPGMIDSHLHPPGKAMSEMFSINLPWLANKEALLGFIKAFC